MNIEKNIDPIFIVGIPRSGTTLMSALLSAHPGITISPETHFFQHWFKHFSQQDISEPKQVQIFWKEYINTKEFKRFGVSETLVNERIRQVGDLSLQSIFNSLLMEYALKMEKARWGEKTPGHFKSVDLLLEWYPQARVIWMLRDPRAVIASRKVVPWSSALEHEMAERWKRGLQIMETWSMDERVHIVRYEELVTDAQKTLKTICAFLSEPYKPEMFVRTQNDSLISNLSGWDKEHIQRSLSPIDSASLLKWRSAFSPKQIALIEHILRPELKKYGYQQTTTKITTLQLVSWTWIRVLRKFSRMTANWFRVLNSETIRL